jgi:hypothetical protein
MSKSHLKRRSFGNVLAPVVALAAMAISSHIAFSAPITVINADFEDITGLDPTPSADTTFSNDNTLDLNVSSQFGGSSGWKEYNSSGVATQVNNVGVINVALGDIGIETPDASDNGPGSDGTNPRMAAYFENSGSLRQTTAHTISALDTSFTLSVDIGNAAVPGYRGYTIALYAFDSGTSTFTPLKTITSADSGAVNPGDNAWATVSLSLAPADFSGFTGQAIGISLGWLNVSPYNVRETFMDNVSLSFTAIPEPSSVLLLSIGGFGMIGIARQRNRRPSTTRSYQG